jgi:hypothetical protein
MKQITLVSLGVTIASVGFGILIAPIIWPEFYRAWYNSIIQFDTNGVGFIAIGIGAILLAAAVLRLPNR